MTTRIRRLCAFAALAALAGAASAHPGHEATTGFTAGLVHPLGGPDHLLAMLAVGLWSAAALQGRQRGWGPAAFASAMLAGAGLGAAGLVLPGLEPGIAASVVLLALLLVAPGRTAGLPGLLVVGAAGLAHGMAHGAEAPATALFAAYAAGFTLSTLLLHGAGLALGERMRSLGQGAWRALAASMALAGTVLLAARI